MKPHSSGRCRFPLVNISERKPGHVPPLGSCENLSLADRSCQSSADHASLILCMLHKCSINNRATKSIELLQLDQIKLLTAWEIPRGLRTLVHVGLQRGKEKQEEGEKYNEYQIHAYVCLLEYIKVCLKTEGSFITAHAKTSYPRTKLFLNRVVLDYREQYHANFPALPENDHLFGPTP